MRGTEVQDLTAQLGALIPEPEPDAPDAEEEERARVRARAREFLGIPDSATLEEIQDAFGADLWAFWLFFFSHFRRDDAGNETAAPEFHREFCDQITDLALGRRPHPELARAYPREHAKSVIATLAAPIWATANRIRKFPFLFSDTDTQAWGFLEDIRIEVETNEELRAIYPDYCTWGAQPRVNRLVFGNGTLIMAAGSGKSVRGARKGAQRPDMIVLDDIENDEEVEKPDRRRKKRRWYSKVVKKLGKAAVYLIVGTILHAESFLSWRIRGDADVFAAVVQDAERQDLWQAWEEILRDRGRESPEADARAFYEAHQEEMERGAVVLWPHRFTLYQLYLERAEDLASYLTERQNRPFDPTASWFPEEKIVWVEKEEADAQRDQVLLSVGFWDPSRGTSKGDTSSLVRLDVLKDGRRFIAESVTDRIPPEEIMDVIIGWQKRRPFHVLGVEKVGLSSYDEQLQTRLQAAGLSLTPVPVTPQGDKKLRIKSLRPMVVAGTMVFSASLPIEAVHQLKYFPQHPNDDFPDGVQQANAIADEYTKDVAPASASREPEPGSDVVDPSGALGREPLRDAPPCRMPRLEERLGLLERVVS